MVRLASAFGLRDGTSGHDVPGAQRREEPPPRSKKRTPGLWSVLMSILPTIVLLIFVLALLSTGVLHGAPRWDAVLDGVREFDIADAMLLLLMAMVTSAVLGPLQLSIVRVLEGYWGGSFLGVLLSGISIGVQRRRVERLQRTVNRPARSVFDAHRQDVAASHLDGYPEDVSLLLPTRLGNALRAAEAQAGQRYGLETVTVWPRLHVVLSDRMEEILADLRDQLDIAARLCAVLLLATLISAGLLFRYGWWLLVPATTALLAWLAYRAAVQAAISFGEQLYVAFDLHRFDLLRELHLPLPRTPGEELEFNQRLSEFLRERQPGDAVDIDRYRHGEAESTGARVRQGPVPL